MKSIHVFIVFYLYCPANIIGLWWAVGSPLVMDPNSICRKSRKIGGKQHEICQKQPELVREVANGARVSIHECQLQFANRRWNCSTTHKRSLHKIMKLEENDYVPTENDVDLIYPADTRETAFLHAISSAAVLHQVTQSCSLGHLPKCYCDRHYKEDIATDGQWEWGGCSDNIAYGYRISKDFMDLKQSKRNEDIRTSVHRHNNEAGRQSLVKYMRRVCKCHGLSGSCTLKTCWKKMPVFHNVGKRLKDRFDAAVKVTGTNDGQGLMPVRSDSKQIETEDLIYTEASPNFCKPNRKYGSLGTKGRECDPFSMGVGGCEILCCGKGFKQEKVTVFENCNCKFKWCCEVVCQTCIVMKTLYTCN